MIRRVLGIDSNGRLIGGVTLGDIARGAQSKAPHKLEGPSRAKALAEVTEAVGPCGGR